MQKQSGSTSIYFQTQHRMRQMHLYYKDAMPVAVSELFVQNQDVLQYKTKVKSTSQQME